MKLGKLLLVVAALLILFSLTARNFLTAENMLDLAEQISVNAILAFGMTFAIIIGGIDLSVGAVLAVVGTTTVFVLSRGNSTSQDPARLALSITAGLTVAAAFGLVNGLCAAKTAMPAFIVTLGTMLVARGMALRYNEARPIQVATHETAFLALGSGRVCGVPCPVIIMLGLFAVMGVLLHRTRFGQHLYAIGGNREAARFTGIPLARHEVVVYVLCGLTAGIAGIISTSRLYMAEPGAGEGFELNAIAAAVVGGTSFTGGVGTMFGTLIGAIIIGILDKGLNQSRVHFSWQYVVKGLVILAAVYMDVRGRERR